MLTTKHIWQDLIDWNNRHPLLNNHLLRLTSLLRTIFLARLSNDLTTLPLLASIKLSFHFLLKRWRKSRHYKCKPVNPAHANTTQVNSTSAQKQTPPSFRRRSWSASFCGNEVGMEGIQHWRTTFHTRFVKSNSDVWLLYLIYYP